MRNLMIVCLLLSSAAFSTVTETTSIGKVRLDMTTGGLLSFTRAGGANWVGNCVADKPTMWITTTSTVDQRKGMLSLILAARAANMKVKIIYDVGTDNYCRIADLEIQ